MSILLAATTLNHSTYSVHPVTPSIPTVILQEGVQQAIAPDWSAITFANLPGITQSGSLGDHHWQAGQPLEQFMTLGDFQDSFRLQDLNLYAIALATQTDPSTISLSQFKLLHDQTLADLVTAIPQLGKRTVHEVPLIAALLKSAKPSDQLADLTPLSLLVQDPTLGTLRLNNLDLSHYSLNDIPGLLQTPLQAFKDWQQAGIDDVPNLRTMPWSQFPVPPTNEGTIGVVQVPQSTTRLTRTISGSDRAGYHVPCPSILSCPSIEFSSAPTLADKHWISGAVQMVQGGTGELSRLNQGIEPTGRHVFSDAFKVVITDIRPHAVETALYFHLCNQTSALTSISCSPYAIGPVPFLTVHPGDPIIVGVIEASSAQAPTRTNRSESVSSPPNQSQQSHSLWQQWIASLSNWIYGLLQTLHVALIPQVDHDFS